MLRPIVLALALTLPLPASAAADVSLVRGAFGHGIVSAGSAPPCMTPPATPATRRVDCGAIGAADFSTCGPVGTDTHCNITLTAQAPNPGWAFKEWAAVSSRCAGGTAACTFRTRERDCDANGGNCVEREFGPFLMVAVFENRRSPTVTFGRAPAEGDVVFDDSATQTFTWTTDEDDEAPTFRCAREGGRFEACTSPHTLRDLSDGEHFLCVFGIDASGSPSNQPDCRTWRQEITPVVEIVAAPPAVTTATDASFTYASSKTGPGFGFECALDGAPFAPCLAEGRRMSGLSTGPHEFSVRVVLGTAATAAVTHTWRVEPPAEPEPLFVPLLVPPAPVVDTDEDGFPRELDCNDRSARIRPGTREIPGNAIDENCDGVRAPFPRVAAVIAANYVADEDETRFTRLRITEVPRGGKVRLRCSGPRRACPFARRSLKVTRAGKADALVGRRRGLLFRAGALVEVSVTAPDAIGRVRRFRVLVDRVPRVQDLCLRPNAKRPHRC